MNELYKRITEAYYVLRDDSKRKKYLADVTGADRKAKLRFTEAAETETKLEQKKAQEEQIGTHPKGRQFFQTGMQDFEAQRWAGAERNFKMALTYEPQNARYKEKLTEVQVTLVLAFAVIGAFTGAARQVAQLLAMGVAYFCSKPIGGFLGPKASAVFHLPLVLGVVGATFLVFVVVVMAVRAVLTSVLRRVISGGNPAQRGLDRLLGFLLGGAKVALFAYVGLCALAFVEQNVSLAGRQLGLGPKGSTAFALAKRYNVFELTAFSQAQDLGRIAKARADPHRLPRLRTDPAYRALLKDARFQRALDDPALRRALETGDYQALLRSDSVLELLQDPSASARLSAAAEAADR